MQNRIRNKRNNQLEKIDLHGLTAKEAAEYADETLKLVKGLVNSGELKTAADGTYTIRIVTVTFFWLTKR